MPAAPTVGRKENPFLEQRLLPLEPSPSGCGHPVAFRPDGQWGMDTYDGTPN